MGAFNAVSWVERAHAHVIRSSSSVAAVRGGAVARKCIRLTFVCLTAGSFVRCKITGSTPPALTQRTICILQGWLAINA